MSVALPRPRGDPTSLKKILNIFIDHKLLDGERILLKYPTLMFAKKWVWSCHAPQGGQNFLGIFF